jgi:hypothetical protein
MLHIFLQAVCFILWVFALNSMLLVIILLCKRAGGSALLFTTAIACLMLWMGIGLKAHVDITWAEPYAVVTMPMVILFLGKRKSRGKS